jgi:biuret amidohydrolase
VERAYGLEIPRTLEEACAPDRAAQVVHDMQVGILRQLTDGSEVLSRGVKVLGAARRAGLRVFFMRYMSRPKELSGVFQLRMAMV